MKHTQNTKQKLLCIPKARKAHRIIHQKRRNKKDLVHPGHCGLIREAHDNKVLVLFWIIFLQVFVCWCYCVCVRVLFLCGIDRDKESRRTWLTIYYLHNNYNKLRPSTFYLTFLSPHETIVPSCLGFVQFVLLLLIVKQLQTTRSNKQERQNNGDYF